MVATIYKLGQSAERSWRRLRIRVPRESRRRGKFRDGIEVKNEMRVKQKYQTSRVAA